MSTIQAHVQQADAGKIIELWWLYVYQPTLTTYWFTNDKNQLGNDIVFNGVTYVAWPIQATGFERSTDSIARPTLSVANVVGTISELCRVSGDLVGSRVDRIRTFEKYLDGVNFPGGVNVLADPTAQLPTERYRINRKTGEGSAIITFELTPYWDISGQKLPRRMCLKNTCSAEYRGAECGYVGGYVDANGAPTADPAQDVCSKRLDDCKARFGGAPLPFGGFPGLRRVPR